MTAAFLVAFDALALVVLGAALVIAVTGGGRFELAGHEVRAHSIGNLLVFLTIWCLARYPCRQIPLLSMRALPLATLPRRALQMVQAAGRRLDGLTRREAWKAVVLTAVLVGLLKVVLALVHPGFFGGDDVEVHEMTLGVLLGFDWPVWDLRSAFHPMTVVYPAQWLSWSLGWSDVTQLVFAGRLAVVTLSTFTVIYLYRVASVHAGAATGIVAAVLLATSSLSVEFGATELPRPVAALLVTCAYGALVMAPRIFNAIGAGVLIGIAACLRFSEVVFLLPLLGHLTAERRFVDAVCASLAMAATAVAIQFASDLLYWGTPFESARAIVNFTLVDRLSSRGYEAWWYYALQIPSWSDYLTIALALYATRRHARLGLWVWLPILALSLLPHKEPRYLVPVVPLLSLLAAHGAIAAVTALRTRSAPATPVVALALLAAISLRTLDQASKYHVVRTDSEVSFARRIASSLSPAPVLVEQVWRFGGHLYLGHGRTVVEVDANSADEAGFAEATTRLSPGLVVLSEGTCDRLRCEATLRSLGLDEQMPSPLAELGYRVFRRQSARAPTVPVARRSTPDSSPRPRPPGAEH